MHLSKHGHCKVLCDHFTKKIWKTGKYRVQILKKMERNRRTKIEVKESSFAQKRKAKEAESGNGINSSMLRGNTKRCKF